MLVTLALMTAALIGGVIVSPLITNSASAGTTTLTPTFIGSDGGGAQTPTTNTRSVTTPASDFVAIFATWDNTSTASVVTDWGDTVIVAAPRQSWGPLAAWSAQTFYIDSTKHDNPNITVTIGSPYTTFFNAQDVYYSGVEISSAPVDAVAFAKGAGTAMSVSATTTNPTDLMVSFGVSQSGVIAAPGWATRQVVNNMRVADQRSSTAGAQTATMTNADVGKWAQHLLAVHAGMICTP